MTDKPEVATPPVLCVSIDTPGVYTLQLGSEQITVTFSDRSRSAMALHALADAIRIEERNARDGMPDLNRWSGAFNIPEPNGND